MSASWCQAIWRPRPEHRRSGSGAEELGRNLTPSPFLSTAVLAVVALERAGNEAQQKRLLPAIAESTTVLALATDDARDTIPKVSRAPLFVTVMASLSTARKSSLSTGMWRKP